MHADVDVDRSFSVLNNLDLGLEALLEQLEEYKPDQSAPKSSFDARRAAPLLVALHYINSRQ